MPELPEVQTVVTTLRPKVVGHTITGVRHLRADIVSPAGFELISAIAGRTVREIDRRAKRIVFTLDDGNRFYVHLGMTGRLTVEPDAAAVPKHTHLICDLSDGPTGAGQLRFRDPRRFGGVFWMGSETDDDVALGPDPLHVKSGQLAQRLSRTTRAIKSALLDQRVIAGLGNIYVDEALFLAGIHPLIRSDRLSGEQVRRLNRAIKQTLRRAIRHRGSTLRDYVDADGAGGGFQLLHRVYDRADEPCVTCRTKIKRIVLGGRSTCFCPRCQKRNHR